jgi:hypothetical protein
MSTQSSAANDDKVVAKELLRNMGEGGSSQRGDGPFVRAPAASSLSSAPAGDSSSVDPSRIGWFGGGGGEGFGPFANPLSASSSSMSSTLQLLRQQHHFLMQQQQSAPYGPPMINHQQHILHNPHHWQNPVGAVSASSVAAPAAAPLRRRTSTGSASTATSNTTTSDMPSSHRSNNHHPSSRREKNRTERERRQNETEEERLGRLEKRRVLHLRKVQTTPADELEAQRAKRNAVERAKRMMETPEDRLKRLAKRKEYEERRKWQQQSHPNPPSDGSNDREEGGSVGGAAPPAARGRSSKKRSRGRGTSAAGDFSLMMRTAPSAATPHLLPAVVTGGEAGIGTYTTSSSSVVTEPPIHSSMHGTYTTTMQLKHECISRAACFRTLRTHTSDPIVRRPSSLASPSFFRICSARRALLRAGSGPAYWRTWTIQQQQWSGTVDVAGVGRDDGGGALERRGDNVGAGCAGVVVGDDRDCEWHGRCRKRRQLSAAAALGGRRRRRGRAGGRSVRAARGVAILLVQGMCPRGTLQLDLYVRRTHGLVGLLTPAEGLSGLFQPALSGGHGAHGETKAAATEAASPALSRIFRLYIHVYNTQDMRVVFVLIQSPASKRTRRRIQSSHEYTMMYLVVYIVTHAIVKDPEPLRRPISSPQPTTDLLLPRRRRGAVGSGSVAAD